MDPIIEELKVAYAGMTAEQVFADMQESGADQMFADAWLVANYIGHLASGAT